MRYTTIRMLSAINRFGTLRLANWAFADAKSPMNTSRSLFGYKMQLDLARSNAQQLLLLEGERFVDERHAIRRLLTAGMTAIDVGANIGYYLLLIEQQVGPTGKVICVEPSDENLPELRKNITSNSFANVVLHPVALGAEDGEIGLRTGINSGIEHINGGAYVVPIRRLDSLVAEPVHFIKIDVEGYEGQVLLGAQELLKKFKPKIFLELHPHIVGKFGFTISQILTDLAQHYGNIKLYEKASIGHGLWAKIAVRYFGRDGLIQVKNQEEYVRLYDDGKTPHTFWAVCEE